MTAEELLDLNLANKRTELVRGQLMVREPAGYVHGRLTSRLATVITNYVDAHGLGEVLAAETGFRLTRSPDTVRAPDIAFISKARIPDAPGRGFPEMAPDLAVEVLSPDDRPSEVLAKVGEWLAAGCRLVWVVDPLRKEARIHRADGSVSRLDADGSLEGEELLPGFRCPLRDVLPQR